MMHQDQGRNGSGCSHAYDLHKALQWLMAGVSLCGIALRPDCTWTPETLVFAALLWAWSDEKTLIERFTTARKIIIHRYGEQQEPAGSYGSAGCRCKTRETNRIFLACSDCPC